MDGKNARMAVQRIVSPIDNSIVAERETITERDRAAVLDRAATAQREWRAVAVDARITICERAVSWFEAHADDVAAEITAQMGRPIAHSPYEITRGFQERARYMASLAPRVLADTDAPTKEGFTRFIRREPVGTVLVVAPWNYPYLTSVNTIVPALLAGNSVILKHATQTLLCAERWAEAFAAAGMPDGVFQVVHATHADVAALIADPRIGFVAFTGSVDAGHSINHAARERFIGTGLELGGKDPSYVRPDADLVEAIAENVDGAFFNAGQSCCGIERIYVHDDVYEAFVDGFVAATRTYVLGDPRDPATTLGPMVNASSAAFVRDQIAAALAAGARALVTEHEFVASQAGTPYLGPTVLVDVDHSMRIMREESFGPVIGIQRVSGDEEAVRLMNDSDYGLTASIWSRDVDAALALGNGLETGTVFLNRCDYLDPALAWTGVKDTGHGTTLSPLGFDAVTRPKSFHLRFP